MGTRVSLKMKKEVTPNSATAMMEATHRRKNSTISA